VIDLLGVGHSCELTIITLLWTCASKNCAISYETFTV